MGYVEDCRSLVVLPRWMDKIEASDDGCIVWKASGTSNGYGRIRLNGRYTLVHRISWVVANGREIPSKMQIDHLCRVRGCVSSDHLDLVTSGENTRRGESFAAILAAKEVCDKGHPFESVSWPSTHKRRVCKECSAMSWKLIRDAAAILGMSATKYTSIYGWSYVKAEEVIEADRIR